tara:strand:+ start:4786 stop:5163 length:378 start_codon:yes stop_codon:yes gene_type:complete
MASITSDQKRKCSGNDEGVSPKKKKKTWYGLKYNSNWVLGRYHNCENIHEEYLDLSEFRIITGHGSFPMSAMLFSEKEKAEAIVKKRAELLNSKYGKKYLEQKNELEKWKEIGYKIKSLIKGDDY